MVLEQVQVFGVCRNRNRCDLLFISGLGLGFPYPNALQQQLQQQQLMLTLNQCLQQITMQQLEMQNMQRQMQNLSLLYEPVDLDPHYLSKTDTNYRCLADSSMSDIIWYKKQVQKPCLKFFKKHFLLVFFVQNNVRLNSFQVFKKL